MIRRRMIATALATILGGTFFFLFYDGAPEPTPTGAEAAAVTEEWMDIVHQRAQPGYWLVVRGTHVGDQVVAAGSAAQLTHAAVLDADRDEIIEAVGSGVAATPLHDLLAESVRLVIVRPRRFTSAMGRAAVQRARTRIGKTYDYLGTLGFQSDRRFYCTELALDAYHAREEGWMPAGVVHPEHMQRYGETIYDSGMRPRTLPVPIPAPHP